MLKKMKIKTGLTVCLVAALSAPVVMPHIAQAQWVQIPLGVPRAPGCDAGYSWQKIGVRYQCVTPQPSCAYGFASGPSWNGSTWVYSCNAPPPPPPPPACQSGYTQTVAPTWNGSAWVGQQCTPIQQQRPPGDPRSQCAARAQQDGITLSPENVSRRRTYNSYAGPATQYYYDTSIGPNWQVGGYSGNSWTVVCSFVIATGDWVPAANNPYVRAFNQPYDGAGGG
jgi:hypothetical protein